MKQRQRNEAQRRRRSVRGRKKYATPQLVPWGGIRDLTRGATGSNDDGFTGSAGT